MVELALKTQIVLGTVVLEIAVPAVLLLTAGATRPATRLTWLARTVLVGAYLAALGVIGQFAVPVPWFAPYAYGLALFAAALVSLPRCRTHRWGLPPGRARRLGLAVTAVSALVLAAAAGAALRGYLPPPGPSVNLRFPLDHGLYYVSNAGASQLINHHRVTLHDDFRRDYRGQSYGVDIARVDILGVAARGFLPDDPAAYAIFGRPVHAPCTGRITESRDGLPDQRPPRRDLGHPLGNHVMIACKGVVVVLAHLQKGSVGAHTGEFVRRGQRLARVGNSGETTSPHLHIHAQRRGTRYAPLSGKPVSIRFDGRYLVRNSLVWR